MSRPVISKPLVWLLGLKELAPDLTLFGMGGDLMEEAGVELIYHIRDSAVMGIGEVFTAIPCVPEEAQTSQTSDSCETP